MYDQRRYSNFFTLLLQYYERSIYQLKKGYDIKWRDNSIVMSQNPWTNDFRKLVIKCFRNVSIYLFIYFYFFNFYKQIVSTIIINKNKI